MQGRRLLASYLRLVIAMRDLQYAIVAVGGRLDGYPHLQHLRGARIPATDGVWRPFPTTPPANHQQVCDRCKQFGRLADHALRLAGRTRRLVVEKAGWYLEACESSANTAALDEHIERVAAAINAAAAFARSRSLKSQSREAEATLVTMYPEMRSFRTRLRSALDIPPRERPHRFLPASAFGGPTFMSRIRAAAQPDRLTMRVESRNEDGGKLYCLRDVKKWWPLELPDGLRSMSIYVD